MAVIDITRDVKTRVKRVQLPGDTTHYWGVFAGDKHLSTHSTRHDAVVVTVIHNQAVERLRPKTEPLIEEARKALGLAAPCEHCGTNHHSNWACPHDAVPPLVQEARRAARQRSR